jgi:hypothetical protein
MYIVLYATTATSHNWEFTYYTAPAWDMISANQHALITKISNYWQDKINWHGTLPQLLNQLSVRAGGKVTVSEGGKQSTVSNKGGKVTVSKGGKLVRE